MGKIKDISIVITTYNESENIKLWCESVLNQSILPKELVIVDSDSTDGTLDIINSIFNDSAIDVVAISQKCNISQGRNIAISNTSCDLLAVTDGGVILDTEWLSNIYEGLQEYEVIAGYYSFGGSNAFQVAYNDLFYVSSSLINEEKFLPSSRSLGLRKYCWESVAGYDESFLIGEDTDFDLKLKGKNFSFKFEPKAKVTWELRSNLKAMFKQHYLYSRWDALIGQNKKGHAFFVLYFITNLAILVSSLFIPLFYILLLLVLATPMLLKGSKSGEELKSTLIARFLVLNTCYLAKGIGFIKGFIFANRS